MSESKKNCQKHIFTFKFVFILVKRKRRRRNESVVKRSVTNIEFFWPPLAFAYRQNFVRQKNLETCQKWKEIIPIFLRLIDKMSKKTNIGYFVAKFS